MRLADGQEVAKQIGRDLWAISVSKDDKWILCGTSEGAGVWDGEMRKEVIHVEDEIAVDVVDVAPDSTRFATGTYRGASIWSILTGQRLAGPFRLDGAINGVRFSPNGEHIATAWSSGIRIFDSHTGVELVSISTDQPDWGAITPIAWSGNGQRIFSASRDNKIRAFDASTGTQLTESQSLYNGTPSIALATNGNSLLPSQTDLSHCSIHPLWLVLALSLRVTNGFAQSPSPWTAPVWRLDGMMGKLLFVISTRLSRNCMVYSMYVFVHLYSLHID